MRWTRNSFRHAHTVPTQRVVSGRFLLKEAAGSLGDLGTFVPIVVGMVQIVGLDAGTVFVWAGLANIITGLTFGIPIAVQPMKAIAALAITGVMGPSEVAVAGLTVGLAMFVAGVSGFIGRLHRLIPRPVVRGLQMMVAVQLMIGGIQLGLYQHGGGFQPVWGPDALSVFLGGMVICVLLRHRPGWAMACLIGVGLAGACVKDPTLLRTGNLFLWHPRWTLPDPSGLAGIWLGGVPQIPMTLLNAVFATSALAGELFPHRRAQSTPGRLAVSVGIMNLVACPLGGMPMCHGSGGLAGQHQFGARTGISMVMLGSAKLGVGLLFGATALAWLQAFPSSILGVFLLVAAAGLARASGCWETPRTLLVTAVMLALHLVTGILVLGFVSGWIVSALLPRKGSRADALDRPTAHDSVRQRRQRGPDEKQG